MTRVTKKGAAPSALPETLYIYTSLAQTLCVERDCNGQSKKRDILALETPAKLGGLGTSKGELAKALVWTQDMTSINDDNQGEIIFSGKWLRPGAWSAAMS